MCTIYIVLCNWNFYALSQRFCSDMYTPVICIHIYFHSYDDSAVINIQSLPLTQNKLRVIKVIVKNFQF